MYVYFVLIGWSPLILKILANHRLPFIVVGGVRVVSSAFVLIGLNPLILKISADHRLPSIVVSSVRVPVRGAGRVHHGADDDVSSDLRGGDIRRNHHRHRHGAHG